MNNKIKQYDEALVFERHGRFFCYIYYYGIVIEVNSFFYRFYLRVKNGKWKKWAVECLIAKTRDSIIDNAGDILVYRTGFDEEAYLSFAPTYSCNFRCKYCFGKCGESYSEEKKEFDDNTLVITLNAFFFELFPNRKHYRIDFISGGEPLLGFNVIKKTVKYVEELRKKGYNIALWLCTNGSLLDDEKSSFLSEHNISIGVSLDGTQELNDQNRILSDGTGTYNLVTNHIRRMLNNPKLSDKIKEIWGSCVITNMNYDFVEIIIEFRKIGFSNLQMRLVRDESCLCAKKINKSYDDFSVFLLNSFKKGDYTYLMMILNEHDQFGKILLKVMMGSVLVYRCNAGKNRVTICPNGDVYPCDSFVGKKEYLIGNIGSEIVHRDFIKHVNDIPKCNRCEYKLLCGGDCLFDIYQKRNNEFKNDDYCNIQKHIIRTCIELRYNMEKIDSKAYERLVHRVQLRDEYRGIYG